MKSPLAQPIDKQLLDKTSRKALDAPRKRINHNFHHPGDTIQRFLNAIEPDSYIRPHRHANPLREEIFMVLRGRGGVLIFNDHGIINAIHLLDSTMGYWGADIPGGLYHTIVSLQSGSVFYEVKQGPYNPDTDKGFAPWSPAEGSIEAAAYLKQLRDKINDYQATLK